MEEHIKTKIKIAKCVKDTGTQGIEWEKAKDKLDLTDSNLITFVSSGRGRLSELVAIDIQEYGGPRILMPYEKLYYMDESEIESYLTEEL